MKDLLTFEIENKQKLENFNDWIYIRMKYNSNFVKQNFENKNKKSSKKYFNKKLLIDLFGIKLIRVLKFLFLIFYGFFNWFNSYEILLISDCKQRVLIEGKYYNKLVDPIIEKLKPRKSLLIEIMNSTPYKLKMIKTKYIVSFNGIRVLVEILRRILKCLMSKKYSIKLKNFEKLFSDLKCFTDYKSMFITSILYQICLEKIFYLIFKIYKIKILFITCYYGKEGIIKAAKKLKIKVIEIQHGVIGNNHPAYNSLIKLDKNCIPDKLLTFSKEGANKEFIIKDIFPIGSFYLEYINSHFVPDEELLRLLNKYKFSFSVSLQITCENELIEFILVLASKYVDYIFILIPRFYTKKYDSFILPSNVIFYPKLDFYQITKHCNFHISAYSTTSLEAPSLGKPNILFNINGYAKKYYGFMEQMKHTIIIENDLEFFYAVQNLSFLEEKDIILTNSSLFINNYNKNIEDFLEII